MLYSLPVSKMSGCPAYPIKRIVSFDEPFGLCMMIIVDNVDLFAVYNVGETKAKKTFGLREVVAATG